MTPFITALLIVIIYITTSTIVAVNYCKNRKKELEKEYEDRINRIGCNSLSQAIQIEMHEETIRQLRFDHKACKSCRKDTIEINTSQLNDIKILSKRKSRI
jgi:hypothetical protein